MVDIGITGGFFGARETDLNAALREYQLLVQGGLQTSQAVAGINANNALNAREARVNNAAGERVEGAERVHEVRRQDRIIQDEIILRNTEVGEDLTAEGEDDLLRDKEALAAARAESERVIEQAEARANQRAEAAEADLEAADAVAAARAERIEAEEANPAPAEEPPVAEEEEARPTVEDEILARIAQAPEDNEDLLEILRTRLTVEDDLLLREVEPAEAPREEFVATANAEARQTIQDEIIARAQAEQAKATAAVEEERQAEAPAGGGAAAPNAAEAAQENERLTGVGNTVDIFV